MSDLYEWEFVDVYVLYCGSYEHVQCMCGN